MFRSLIISLFSLFIVLQFTGCQISTNLSGQKAPETRDEKLAFYRGQIFTFETDIDFHLKNQMDLNLKVDYEKLEETLKGLSSLLDKPEQESITIIIQDMQTSMEEFKKLKNYSLFTRQKEKLFSKLRKLKKVIQAKEKENSKNKVAPKEEEKGNK